MLVDRRAETYANSVRKPEGTINILNPKIGIGLVTGRLAAEISLSIIGCRNQFWVAELYCVDADVASSTEGTDEDKNAKNVSTSSVTERTVLNGGVDLVVVSFVVRIRKTLALLS